MGYLQTQRAANRYRILLNKLINLEDEMYHYEEQIKKIKLTHNIYAMDRQTATILQVCVNKHQRARAKHQKALAEVKKLEVQYGFFEPLY